jgi:hypothetical protein
MNNIIIAKKDLLKIRNDLNSSIKNCDPLLNSLEPCLVDEDWKIIHKIEDLLLKSVRKIDRLLNSIK